MDRFSKLIEGYQKFRNELTPEMKSKFQELAKGQDPGALLITCSDSRIDPSLFTGASPGELFVVRNAGNIVPNPNDPSSKASLGTIEFAIEVLKVRDIIVCGHSECGAVKAMMDPQTLMGLPYLEEWISEARKSLEIVEGKSEIALVQANAVAQVRKLFEIQGVAERVEKGLLNLHAWVFDIGEAKLESFDFQTEDWKPMIMEAHDPQDQELSKFQKPQYCQSCQEMLKS